MKVVKLNIEIYKENEDVDLSVGKKLMREIADFAKGKTKDLKLRIDTRIEEK